MHKYLIELQKYSQDGGLLNEYTYDSADTPQSAMDKYSKWNKVRYTNDDGSVGFKMYKVTLKQGVYAPVEDIANFVSVNAVEYHA